MKSILACSVIAGIVESVFPGTALKKHLQYILSFLTFLILISPLAQIMPSIGSLQDSVEDFLARIEQAEQQGTSNGKELILNYGEETVQNRVRELLKQEFLLNPNEVDTELILDDEGQILGVMIILSGTATWSEDSKIKTYLSDQMGCTVTIKRR